MGPRYHAINLQPPQNASSVSKKKGTFTTIGKNRLGIMNSQSEIFNSFGCKTRFCQFTGGHLGTDDGVAPKTV